MHNPSRAIALFGTDEPVTPPRVLRAGMLSAELEAGNLRYIRWNGEEVLRAISFIVRDPDWGTLSLCFVAERVLTGGIPWDPWWRTPQRSVGPVCQTH